MVSLPVIDPVHDGPVDYSCSITSLLFLLTSLKSLVALGTNFWLIDTLPCILMELSPGLISLLIAVVSSPCVFRVHPCYYLHSQCANVSVVVVFT